MKLIYLTLFVSLWDYINSVELTFELPDNDKQCYYQDIEKNRTGLLEYQVCLMTINFFLNKLTKILGVFQVITGGQYDVDVELLSPNKEILYKQIKSQFDSHQFTAAVKN